MLDMEGSMLYSVGVVIRVLAEDPDHSPLYTVYTTSKQFLQS